MSHVCRLSARHRVEPGLQIPVQTPIWQTYWQGGAELTQAVPLGQFCGVRPLHRTAVVEHVPEHIPIPTQTAGHTAPSSTHCPSDEQF